MITSKKHLISLRADTSALRMLKLAWDSNEKRWEAVESKSIDLSQVFVHKNQDSAEDEADSTGDVFGISDAPEDTSAPQSSGTNGSAPKEDVPDTGLDLDMDLDMDLDEEKPDSARAARNLVLDEMQQALFVMGGRKPDVAVVMPSGSIRFDRFPKPAEKQKSRKTHEELRRKLQEVHHVSQLDDDHFRWTELNEHQLLAASYESTPFVMGLLEELHFRQPYSYSLKQMIPEELALLRFAQGREEDKEVSSIMVHLSESGTRIIFVHNDAIYGTMPFIRKKKQVSAEAHITKVFSRLMLELEKGEISYIDQFVIHDEVGLGNTLSDKISQTFEGIPCLFPGEDTSELHIGPGVDRSDGLNAWLSLYNAGLMSQTGLKPAEKAFTFLPLDVQERQKVFKLKWHGLLFLIMIALVPIITNHFYQQLQQETRTAERVLEGQQIRMAELQSIEAEMLAMQQEMSQTRETYDQLRELSAGSRRWTTILGILQDGMSDISSTWITNLQYTGDSFVLEGIGMYRQRISRVADLFHSAGIQQVTENELRDRTFYTFLITVDEVVEDTGTFNPLPDPEMETDAES